MFLWCYKQSDTFTLLANCRLRRTRCGIRHGRYLGCHSGRRKRPSLWLRPVSNGATLIVGNLPPPPTPQDRRPPSSVLRIHVHRHATTSGPELVFAHVNIRSLANKLDDLLDVCHDISVDVLLLVPLRNVARRGFRQLQSPACRRISSGGSTSSMCA